MNGSSIAGSTQVSYNQDFLSLAKTRRDYHNMLQFATQGLGQGELIFVFLVEQYLKDKNPNQAYLIQDWFIYKNFPAGLYFDNMMEGRSFLTEINISSKAMEKLKGTNVAFRVHDLLSKKSDEWAERAGRTRIGRIKKFFNIGQEKPQEPIRPPLELFDEVSIKAAQANVIFQILSPMFEGINSGPKYVPSNTYARNTFWEENVRKILGPLQKAGFKTDQIGIY